MSAGTPLGWDEIAGAAGVAGGALVIALAWRLDLGAWNNPGPGMMPVLLGVFLAGLSATLWIVSRRRAQPAVASGPGPWSGARWRAVLSTLVVLLIYAAVLDTLGYVVATFLLLIVLLRVLEPPRWAVTVLTAAVVTAASHVLFVRLLDVQLPRAVWGF